MKIFIILTSFLLIFCFSILFYYKLWKPNLYKKSISTRLKNTKGASFGDSITWYDGHRFYSTHKSQFFKVIGYQEYLRQYFNCEIDNKGVPGWDITQILNVVKSYDKYNEIKFATLTSGANDARKGVPIGTIKEKGGDFDEKTFIGAFQSAIEHIIKSNNEIDLILITPLNGFFFESKTDQIPGPYNNLKYISEDYANSIKELASLYGLPVCDWYEKIDVSANDILGDKSNIAYKLHPNNKGFKLMGSELIKTISNYLDNNTLIH